MATQHDPTDKRDAFLHISMLSRVSLSKCCSSDERTFQSPASFLPAPQLACHLVAAHLATSKFYLAPVNITTGLPLEH